MSTTKTSNRVYVENLDAYLEEMGARMALDSLSEPLESCGEVLRVEFGENIDAAEGPDGVPWPPHAPATVAKYGPHPLLILTRRMYASLVGRSADGNITRVGDRDAEFGTDITTLAGFFYPEVHNEGNIDRGGHIPQREFFFVGGDVEEAMGEIIADYIDKNFV